MARFNKQAPRRATVPTPAGPRRGAHEIVWRATSSLTPYLRNSRTHTPQQVDKIVNSINTFGFNNPILIDEKGEIIAGHGRLAAAQQAGLAEVPTVTLDHLTDAQKRAYVIADNRITDDAGWNEDLLSIELKALRDEDFDLTTTGFEEDELAVLLEEDGPGGDTDADETPEPQAVVISRIGEVWLLGNHRLICGDSTDAATVSTLLGTVKPHLMVTDPPYGVKYDATWRDHRNGAFGDGKPVMRGVVQNDDRADWREAWALFPGDTAYVWHSALHGHEVAESLVATGFKLRSQIIWKKPHFTLSRGDYHWQHEPCWYVVREGKNGHYGGDRTQSTVWDIAGMNPAGQTRNACDGKTNHSTQKPVECMRKPIENNSSPGQAIYEPFAGSGSTIIACEQTGRICFAIELDPTYIDLIIRRWQSFSTKEATLESDGRTFAEVSAERSA